MVGVRAVLGVWGEGGCGGRTRGWVVLPRNPSDVGEQVRGALHIAHLSNPRPTSGVMEVLR